jgi:hypothetical protein
MGGWEGKMKWFTEEDRKLDRAIAERAFGFRLPDALYRVLEAAWKKEGGYGHEFEGHFHAVTGLTFGGAECRYDHTPPELFPVGYLGVDGVHYGCVIHAPENAKSDYPFAQFSPVDEEGLIWVGRNAAEGLESLVSMRLDLLEAEELTPEETEDAREKLAELQQILKIEPSSAKAGRVFDPEPEVPAGWRYLGTDDQVGVLAPESAFSPTDPHRFDPAWPAAIFADRANKALDKEHPATALFYAREGWWLLWSKDDRGKADLRDVFADAYRALGRGKLADIVEGEEEPGEGERVPYEDIREVFNEEPGNPSPRRKGK